MLGLPQSLLNRFWLYLNILPAFERILYYGSFIVGVILLLVAVTRTSMTLSTAVASSHKISKRRKSQYTSNCEMVERQTLGTFEASNAKLLPSMTQGSIQDQTNEANSDDKQFYLVKINGEDDSEIEEDFKAGDGTSISNGSVSDLSYCDMKRKDKVSRFITYKLFTFFQRAVKPVLKMIKKFIITHFFAAFHVCRNSLKIIANITNMYY